MPVHQQLFAFADAPDLAWCYVIYLRTVTSDGSIHVAFVCGKTRLLQKSVSVKGQLSIPRAELAAARALAERVLEVEEQLDLPDRHPTIYYSDSRDVLAWIKNDFTKEPLKRYTVSRISFIRRVSKPEQWHYIQTGINPADLGTRPISVKDLQASSRITILIALSLNGGLRSTLLDLSPAPPSQILELGLQYAKLHLPMVISGSKKMISSIPSILKPPGNRIPWRSYLPRASTWTIC